METITRKSMLYETQVDYSLDAAGEPINDYAMNHILGCSHGCKYPCYAFLNKKRFGLVSDYEDWCHPKPVENTLDLLARELSSNSRKKRPIKRVHMCFTTDPFQTMREATETCWNDMRLIHETTMDAIDMINRAKIPVTILTKGVLPKPDWEEGALYLQDAYATAYHEVFNPHRANYYGISLVSLNEGFRKEWEPGAAPYMERISSLKALHDAGYQTWVSMEPFPALTSAGMSKKYGVTKPVYEKIGKSPAPESLNDYTSVLAATKPAFGELLSCLYAVRFVDRIVFGRWNYNENMPTDVSDPDEWYKEAARIVRDFCSQYNIECIIKKGTEK